MESSSTRQDNFKALEKISDIMYRKLSRVSCHLIHSRAHGEVFSSNAQSLVSDVQNILTAELREAHDG